MVGELCLLDSNVLIRWVQPRSPEYPVIHASIETLARRNVVLCYISQNLGEFWNTCTRPTARNGFGLSPEDADLRARFIETRIRLLPDSESVHQEWRRLLVTHGISGAQVHDARLAAAMYIHGVNRILTYNTEDFRRFTEIEALHPADVVNIA